MALGELEEEEGFLLGLVGLDGDGGVNVAGFTVVVEIFGHEITLEERHFLSDPRMADSIVLPEVLVRIDSHFPPRHKFPRLIRGD